MKLRTYVLPALIIFLLSTSFGFGFSTDKNRNHLNLWFVNKTRSTIDIENIIASYRGVFFHGKIDCYSPRELKEIPPEKVVHFRIPKPRRLFFSNQSKSSFEVSSKDWPCTCLFDAQHRLCAISESGQDVITMTLTWKETRRAKGYEIVLERNERPL